MNFVKPKYFHVIISAHTALYFFTAEMIYKATHNSTSPLSYLVGD